MGLLASVIVFASAQTALAADLPEGWVRLSTVAPTIRQEILYAGANNFLGRTASGYKKPVCILTTKAAKALAAVQAQLAREQQSLIVFDCYRPRRAVNDFVGWVRQGGAIEKKWSPNTPRADLIREGYIGAKSAHSRGSTVDIAIVDNNPSATGALAACGHAANAMLDFGAGMDCFDPISRLATPIPSSAAKQNRKRLGELMAKAGFRPYSGEWWHFTLRSEPYPKQSFDFPVE